MAGQFFNQPSFAAGEVGPELYGRIDQELYYIGARTVRNFIVRQYGGVSNRSGSRFIAEAKDSTTKSRIIPFQFNEIQTYCLELGEKTMRVVKDAGEVLETAKNITAITKAAQGVVTIAGHGYSDGDDVFISGIVGMTQLNGRSLRVANKTTDTFKMTDYQGNYIDTTAYGTYASGGTAARIYTKVTPWAAEDLFDLNYAQSADVITVVHPDYPVYDVTRTAHDNWTISEFAPADGPFKDINLSATTVTPSAVTGTITLTASAALFSADDVGSLFYIEKTADDATPTWEVSKAIALNAIYRAGYHYYQALNAATTGTVKPDWTEGSATDGATGVRWQYLHSGYGICKITAFTDTTHVTADVIKRLPDHCVSTASKYWAKAAWSKTEGYPSSVTYHKQRVWLGGTVNSPNSVWCSNVGLRSNFGNNKPLLDDDSIALALDTTQVNAVRHLLSLSQLIVLTSSSEIVVNGKDNSILATAPPTPSVQGYNGASKIRPIIIGSTALYVEDTGDVVRTCQYELASDSFTGIDLTARSPHLFRNKTVVDWAYQKRPLAVIWTIMDDGSLNGLTFMQEQKVYAWHRHDTDGLYESVCCIREGNETAAYKMVSRTIGGVTRRYLERDQGRYFDEIRDAFFIDSGLTYDGRNTAATTIKITGGTAWDNTEELTLTASAAIFAATDVGTAQINFVAGNITYRFDISAFTSTTVVTAVPTKDVPVPYRGIERTDWELARKRLGGFWHLEGKTLVALSDGNVVEGLVVTGGVIELPKPGAVVHAGLRYISELETLDMAQPEGKGKARSMNIPRLFLTVQESRAVFVATNAYGNTSQTATTDIADALYDDKFIEIKQRNPDFGYDPAVPAETGVMEVTTNSSWSNTGRICIRQPYPLPISINCITDEVPAGYS